MDFINRFKSFLGKNNTTTNDLSVRSLPELNESSEKDEYLPKSYAAPPKDEFDRFGFHVFSSPLEMHRYFEHQMNEMMKSFGMFGPNSKGCVGDSFFGGEPFLDDNIFGSSFSEMPSDEFHKDKLPGTLRDQYLKPGYEEPKASGNTDSDLDEKFRLNDFDVILPSKPPQKPQHSFFGKFITTKTIRNPDGSTQTTKTTADQDGNEHTVVTQKIDDKEYTVITKRDKTGHQEVTESFVNMDEAEKNVLFKNIVLSVDDSTERGQSDWMELFEKFFK